MTAAVVIGLLTIIAILYVVRPIGRGHTELVEPDDTSDAQDRKRVALAGILDLEDERDGGKLSNDDFRALKLRYERDAVQALKELDAAGSTNLEAQLEREIAEARHKLTCATCGAPRDVDTARCPSCGSSY